MDKIEIKPSKPFSSGMEYEFFLENFCERCNKHKIDSRGFIEFVENGGCPIENAMENARFDISLFPSDDVVRIEENGKVAYWNICKSFETDDAEVMKRYKQLFGEVSNDE